MHICVSDQKQLIMRLLFIFATYYYSSTFSNVRKDGADIEVFQNKRIQAMRK